MPKRVCDTCGKKKDLSGGATCARGHFICRSCRKIKGFFKDTWKRKCPICKTSLR